MSLFVKIIIIINNNDDDNNYTLYLNRVTQYNGNDVS